MSRFLPSEGLTFTFQNRIHLERRLLRNNTCMVEERKDLEVQGGVEIEKSRAVSWPDASPRRGTVCFLLGTLVCTNTRKSSLYFTDRVPTGCHSDLLALNAGYVSTCTQLLPVELSFCSVYSDLLPIPFLMHRWVISLVRFFFL